MNSTDITTTLLVKNIHCPSCVLTITNSLSNKFHLNPNYINVSILTGSITLLHPQELLNKIKLSLEEDGFEVLDSDKTDSNILESGGSRKQQVNNSNNSTSGPSVLHKKTASWFERKSTQEKREQKELELLKKREAAHILSCKACQEDSNPISIDQSAPSSVAKGKGKEHVIQFNGPKEMITILIIEGMTCSSCVSSVKTLLSSNESDSRVISVTVSLLPGQAIIRHSDTLTESELRERVEEGGFEAALVESKEVEVESEEELGWTETRLLIEGMTCSSCTGSLTGVLSPASHPGIRNVIITLLPPLAIVIHNPHLMTKEQLVEEIEDGGFGAEVVSSIPILEDGGKIAKKGGKKEGEGKGDRKVKLRIDGMFCIKCSTAINSLLESLLESGDIKSYTPISLAHPIMTLVYTPAPPKGFTLRSLRTSIANLGPFTIHPITLSSTLSILSAQSQARESTKILYHLLITFVFAIPTFLIAIVFTSLLPSSNNLNLYFSYPIWGSASRGTISLFVLATPIQFGVGTFFYSRAWKGLKNVWKRGSWKEKLWRWGSMDTLVALGTTTAYFASCAFMLLDITTPVEPDMVGGKPGGGGMGMGYFDSSVFLMLFILAGRWLEGISRRRTSEEVEKLGRVKGVTGILYRGSERITESGKGEERGGRSRLSKIDEKAEIEDDDEDDDEDDSGSKRWSLSRSNSISEKSFYEVDINNLNVASLPSSPSYNTNDTSASSTSAIEVDFLEQGDLLLIPSGATVPLDSILLSHSPSSNFDESSLTGESLPIPKSPSSEIYAGSTNLGPSAVIVKVINGPGENMIDGIVGAVREAMSRKASIEKLADLITGYFVPAIVGIAVFTFTIWIIRGYSGRLPKDWLSDGGERGGWVLFSVQFAVAVLVVACPCGIGLAAPTAQMVGTGIAARLGIVPYGGGEAFQNATKIDVVVFDKTGTITKGEFKVSDYQLYPLVDDSDSSSKAFDSSPSTLFSILDVVEETSAHPISVGLRSFCRSQATSSSSNVEPQLLTAEELPGRGLSALISVNGNTQVEVLVGNELLMQDKAAQYGTTFEHSQEINCLLQKWGSEGKSIVLVALRIISTTSSLSPYQIVSIFAIQDPPRSEAAYVIHQLEKKGIAVFMCTGDNQVTALAVARSVGIPAERVFAGVLPVGKRDCIDKLQNGGAREALNELRGSKSWWSRISNSEDKDNRARVLFVGDGINDIVALTQSDVGVSMGTGASVALSSSDFCLLSSNLLSLLTVLSLAQATYYKILTNFAWASLFNTILIPVAAGAFYDLGKTRLPPVWASLAMALSSISVVSNSLLLRWTFKVPKEVTNFSKRDSK